MEADIRATILRLFRQKNQMKDLGEDERYFERGVSSLTIVELQIGVEAALGVTVPTSELMRLQTMTGWIEAYSAKAPRQEQLSAASA